MLAQSQPSLKIERITDRTTVRGRTTSKEAKREQVRVIRDTIIVQRTDTVHVETSEIAGQARNEASPRASPLTSALKWVFAIIIAIIGLIITAKVCLLRR